MTIRGTREVYQTYKAAASLQKGGNLVEIAFLNDYSGADGDRNLYVDFVAIGPRVLYPTDTGVSYVVRNNAGQVFFELDGRRLLDSQGALVFNVDYDPKDWMSQLLEEYDSIGSYLPCYGALLHVAVFPSTPQKEEVQHRCVGFSQLAVQNDYPNPLTIDGVNFRTSDASAIAVEEATGFAPRALRLSNRIEMTFPATMHVEVKSYHAANVSVTAAAYKGDRVLEVKSVGPQADQLHVVVFEGQELDKVVVVAKQDGAFLTEFCYDTIVKRDLGLEDYPYIIDFEPKKRELYEAVTGTGEILSNSSSNLNVRKGVTNTDSTEDFSNFSVGAKAGLDLGVLTIGGSVQTAWGSKDISGVERVNIRTTDDSRQRRETFSHSTNLSQTYHLFNGYHLGTNRSVFFMLPRPYVAELQENGRPTHTFVKGPRRLEGIQEIFLVINRPRSVPGICVEALLETAHLDWKETGKTDSSVPDSIEPTGPTPELIRELEIFLTEKYQDKIVRYYHTQDKASYHYIIIRYYWDAVQNAFMGQAVRKENTNVIVSYSSNTPGLKKSYEDALAEYKRDKPPQAATPSEPMRPVTTQTSLMQTSLILTARSLKGCLPRSTGDQCIEQPVAEALGNGKEWVSMETQIPVNPWMSLPTARPAEKAVAANQLVQMIGQKLHASLGSRERYPRDAVDFLQTRFALNRLKRPLAAMPESDPRNKPVAELEHIDARLRKRFSEAFPDAQKRKQALSIPLNQLRKSLKLTETEARSFQLALMGISQKAKQETHKPLPRKRRPLLPDNKLNEKRGL